MRQTIAKKSRTKTKVISPAEQERRRAKTAIVKADIRREWAMLESYYRSGKLPPRPATPTLHRLTAAAWQDYRKRDRNDARSLRAYWRIRGGEPITSRYFVSNFGGIRLVPPKQCHFVRKAMLPENMQ